MSMTVRFWGTRGAVPVSGEEFAEHGGATTCFEILFGETPPGDPDRIILDGGTGLVRLGQKRPDELGDTLFLQSHMHWDHIQGYPFFNPFYDDDASFEFWSVVREGATLRDIFDRQLSGPTCPIGFDTLAADLDFRTIEETGHHAFETISIEWTEVWHPFGCSAFRIEHDDTSFVFSGDVEVQKGCRQRLVEFAEGADDFLMDAQYLPDEYDAHEGFGHSTADDAVGVAVDADVDRLFMTHHDRSHDDDRLHHKLGIARGEAPDDLAVDNARCDGEIEVG